MVRTNLFKYSVSISFIAALSGCGSGISGGPALNVNLVNATSSRNLAFARQTRSLPFTLLSSFAETPRVVSTNDNTVAQLTHLKYYFISVQVCEGLTTTGTAYNNPTNCIDLYKVTDGGYDTYLAANALADTDPNHYMDLMDLTTTRAKLNKGAAANPGTYNYGIISWFRPIKVTAEVTLANTTNLVTKATTQVAGQVDSQGFTQYYMTVSDLTGAAGTAAEAIVTLNNGGNWFKFQNPWVYDGKEATTLDLVFNPDGIIKGSSNASNYAIRETANGGNALNIPLLDLSPVVHKASETTMKESYTLTGALSDIRLELYYVQEDSAKTVYGADIKSVYGATPPTTNVMDPNKISFIHTNANGSLDFQDYQQAAMLSGFTRGAAGTATLKCGADAIQMGSICSNSSDLTVTYAAPTVAAVR